MAPADMSALSLYAKASADFEAKLAETKAVLQNAAETFSPLTQASSLGAEDMVITHLLSETGITCSVFVLDTGMLHAKTLAKVKRIVYQVNIQTLAQQPATQLEANAIGVIELTLLEPIAALPFATSRILGSLVLVDTASHKTSGAALILSAQEG
jgi:3'-phosphoadenosine 5'-phosphosulfate sulfotransferase (PAPS reductase)/FAD synthetase